MNCARCADERWVCETHGTPWGETEGDCGTATNDCGGPGEPCPDCNDADAPDFPPGSVLLTDFRGNGLWEQN